VGVGQLMPAQLQGASGSSSSRKGQQVWWRVPWPGTMV
jgi:hypothetical protein